MLKNDLVRRASPEHNEEAAIGQLTRSIQANPYEISFYLSRGEKHLNSQQYAKAIDDLSVAAKLDNQVKTIFLNRGLAYLALGQFQDAIKDFTKVIDLDPKNTRAYNNRGQAFKGQNRHEQARVDFSKVIQINSRHQCAYHNRGSVNMELKNLKAAEEDWLMALKLDPSNSLFLFRLSQLYKQTGDEQKSKQYFKEGISAFEKENDVCLRDQFELSDQNISFVKRSIEDYKKLKDELKEIKNDAIKEGKTSVVEKVPEIASAIQKLTMSITNTSQKQQQKNQQSYVKDISLIRKEIQDLRREIAAVQDENKVLKKNFHQEKERRMEIEQQLEQIHEELKGLRKQVSIINKNLFADEKVVQKIKTLENPQQRQYYDKFYRIIIDHFMAYRLAQTGFFSQNPRAYSKFDLVMADINQAQPLLQKIPGLGDILATPCQIFDKYKGIKTSHLNSIISAKIGNSNLKTERIVSVFMAHVISSLIQNDKFNTMLMISIQEEKESYLNRLYQKIGDCRQNIYSKVYGSTEKKYSYINEIVIGHTFLVTETLYEVPQTQFQKFSESQDSFYKMILKSITGQLNYDDGSERQFECFSCAKGKCQIY